MSEFFDQLERDLVDAARRRRAPQRPRRPALLLAAALTLLVGGSAGAATYYVMRASPIAPFAPEDTTLEQTVAAGTSRVLELRAADPQRGLLPWTLRLARSRTGLLCGTVGQADGDAFGLVGLDGAFREIPEANADACGEDVQGDATLLGLRTFDARRPAGVRTVLNGVAGDLAEVRVATRGSRPRRVPHSAEGGFLVALRGYPEDLQPRVTLRLRDGRTRTHAFAVDPFVIPDPLGERAWRLESFVVSRPPPFPARLPACVTFATARAVKGEPAARAPAVCGLEPARRGVPDRTLYFTTRRLSGAGAWNGHPARTAVYGNARVARSLLISAPGVRRTVRPTVNGSFLVVLPPEVDPARVRVEVRYRDGRRRAFGPTTGTVREPRR